MSGDEDPDLSLCGICGIDPVEHENVALGVTEVNMCGDCFCQFQEMCAALAAVEVKEGGA